MSRSPEQRVYDKLERRMAAALTKGRYRLVRIESSTGAGIPDIYCRIGKYSCWIETKDNSYKLSKEQYAWYWAERLAGGEVWIFNGEGMIRPDRNMLDYSSLGRYLSSVEILVLSVEGWLKHVGALS